MCSRQSGTNAHAACAPSPRVPLSIDEKKSSLDGERLAEPRLWASSSILEFAHVRCGDGDPKEAEPFDARHIAALEIIDEEDDERGHVLRQETYKKQMPVMYRKHGV